MYPDISPFLHKFSILHGTAHVAAHKELLNQDSQMVKLRSSLPCLHKFSGCHHNLVHLFLWNNRFTDDIGNVPYVITTIPFPFYICDLSN